MPLSSLLCKCHEGRDRDRFVHCCSQFLEANSRNLMRVSVLSCFSRVGLFCDPMDCSLPGSSVHGIFQTRILEWISSSRGSSCPRDWTCVSYSSCISRQFLYHWVTWEAQGLERTYVHRYRYIDIDMSISVNITESLCRTPQTKTTL